MSSQRNDCAAFLRIDKLLQLASVPFQKVSGAFKAKVFGVDYNHLNLHQDGDLYVTSFGWPYLEYLLPDRWYHNDYFSRAGKRQPDGIGTVFRVPVCNDKKEGMTLVVKFNRFAQSTMLYAASKLPEGLSYGTAANLHINSPFEEFGALFKLRRHGHLLGRTSLLTKRPLAIYSPPERFSVEKLGRSVRRFERCREAMQQDQNDSRASVKVDLDISRDYILLYQWVDGENAQAMYKQGLLSDEEMGLLTIRVNEELGRHGFRVLDNKPQHIILRKRSFSDLLRREGELVYALVDFELLELKPDLL